MVYALNHGAYIGEVHNIILDVSKSLDRDVMQMLFIAGEGHILRRLLLH